MFTGKRFWMRIGSVLYEFWEILWMIWSSVFQSLKLGWIYLHHRVFDYKALPVCVCVCVCVCVYCLCAWACAKSCLTFCNPFDYSPLESLSMEFSRQGYWWGLAFPSPGDLPNPGIKPTSLVSLALACGLFTSWTRGSPNTLPTSFICLYSLNLTSAVEVVSMRIVSYIKWFYYPSNSNSYSSLL